MILELPIIEGIVNDHTCEGAMVRMADADSGCYYVSKHTEADAVGTGCTSA